MQRQDRRLHRIDKPWGLLAPSLEGPVVTQGGAVQRLTDILHVPVTCVLRRERLREVLHLRRLGTDRENSDGQDILRSQRRRFDRGLRRMGDPKHPSPCCPGGNGST